jgi:hypothetical protein
MSIHRPIGYHTNGTKRTLIQRISGVAFGMPTRKRTNNGGHTDCGEI